jgi:L-ribulose-5-phosphate 3-epimerase
MKNTKTSSPALPVERSEAERSEDERGATGKEENADDTAGVDRVIAAFQEMLPLARELKVRISIENHGGASRSAANIVRIIKATDPKWVGALVDFGNFPEEILYDEIAKVLPYAFAIHVKTRDGGEAAYDIDRVFRMLKAQQYKGALSIEFGGKGDPMEGVQKSRELILKHWN